MEGLEDKAPAELIIVNVIINFQKRFLETPVTVFLSAAQKIGLLYVLMGWPSE